jgi:outer membrane murein-binding lipoprotein Lpp
MAEQYSAPTFASDEPEPEFDELVADVRTLRKDVDRLRSHVEPREALLRAQADHASGKLYSDSPADIKRHSVEADLWN